MSGAEVVAVLAVIASIISIVDGTKKVYDAATNTQALPEAFREVAGRLPIVENTLDSTKQYIEEGKVNYDSCKGVKLIVEACEEKAKKLEELFHKAIPADGASDLKRYYKAVKALGKERKVEKLMQGMLEDVQLLACERGMKTATKAQQEQIIKAITEVSAILPSVPEHEFQEAAFTNKNYGWGTQYNAQGENIAQGSARQYMSGGGTMNFGQTNFAVTTQSFSVPLGSHEDDADACLRALFLTDIVSDRAKLVNTKGPRVDGTCQWIMSHSLYDSWLRSNSQLLWLSGGPGKGKTMLSIFLAEELEQMARSSQKTLFLQYFCDNKDEKRNTAVAVLRGLVYQLLQLRPNLFKHILPSFRLQKESMFSFETLYRTFESMICDSTLETTYCVLDGLDECDENLLEILLRKFAALLSAKPNATCHLNLLIVSRDLPDFIPELLSTFPRISLDLDADTEITQDIDLFIKAKVKELSREKNYPQGLVAHVEKVFRNRAQGTFLWIGVVAQVLRKYKATEVEKALDLFPPGLDELYARILLQIDGGRREITARILRWVVMSVRPLTLSELSVAIETTAEFSIVRFTRDEVIRDQVSYCGHFLVIKEDEVGLIHQSAKDYLLRKTRDSNPELEVFRVKEAVANLEIAGRCLDYLQSGALDSCQPKLLSNASHLSSFPFLSCAALHWYEHARSLARSENIFDLSLPFYHKYSQTRMSWLKAHWEVERLNWIVKIESFTLLHLASYFGIRPLVENLILRKGWRSKIERLFFLNKIDSSGRTALMSAAGGGHETVVQLLLEKGANIETKDKYVPAALMTAANIGHVAIVRLLLEKGANTESKDILERTALIAAAFGEHEAVIRLLLEMGADIEAKDGQGWTALITAALYGHEAIVRLLLEKGADIEAKDHNRETALTIGIKNGHEAVVRLLHDKGANIEGRDTVESALIWGAKSGQEAMVRLLLEMGTNINVKDIRGRTALIAAASDGHEITVQLLLEKGADFKALDEFPWLARRFESYRPQPRNPAGSS